MGKAKDLLAKIGLIQMLYIPPILVGGDEINFLAIFMALASFVVAYLSAKRLGVIEI